MAADRQARAVWTGGLFDGAGTITEVTSGAIGPLPVTWASRAEAPEGRTSPEELIAAAHASCYSMQLAHELAEAGTPPRELRVTATVTLVPGTGITRSALVVEGSVDGVDAAGFAAAAERAKTGCPVSGALTGVEITLDARLA